MAGSQGCLPIGVGWLARLTKLAGLAELIWLTRLTELAGLAELIWLARLTELAGLAEQGCSWTLGSAMVIE